MMHKQVTYKINLQYTPWFAIDKDNHFLSYNFIINGEAKLNLVK